MIVHTNMDCFVKVEVMIHGVIIATMNRKINETSNKKEVSTQTIVFPVCRDLFLEHECKINDWPSPKYQIVLCSNKENIIEIVFAHGTLLPCNVRTRPNLNRYPDLQSDEEITEYFVFVCRTPLGIYSTGIHTLNLFDYIDVNLPENSTEINIYLSSKKS